MEHGSGPNGERSAPRPVFAAAVGAGSTSAAVRVPDPVAARRGFLFQTGLATACIATAREAATAQDGTAGDSPLRPVAAPAAAASTAASTADQAAAAAAELNATFRGLYAANRQELLAATPLAALTLIGTGEVWRIEFGKAERSYPPIPWIAVMKGFMHAVIATQATAARAIRAADPQAAAAAIPRLAAAVQEAHGRIAADLPPAVAAPAAAVLAALRGLADGWAAGRPVAADDVGRAIAAVRHEFDAVLSATGEAVYDSIVAGLRRCESESDPEGWRRCFVGVCGVGLARRDNVEIAAAMAVLGREAVGTRLLYLENAFTIEAGIALLGAALADRDVGRDVFGDPERMWRDLLGDVAVRHAGGSFFPETGRPSRAAAAPR